MTATVRLQCEPFDSAREVANVTRGRTDIGAVVTFTGICRGEEAGGPLRAMTLEYYPEMAEAEVGKTRRSRSKTLATPRRDCHPSLRSPLPRRGIVLVITAAAHRHDAFAAAEFLMDYLKTRAPFWKQVESARGKAWVDAKQADDALADRWTEEPSRGEAAE